MTSYVILTLDHAFQSAFSALCEELAAHGVSTVADEGVPAHVTLAAGEALHRVDWHRLTMPPYPQIECHAVATFGATERVWFLAPRVDRALLDCVDAVHHYVAGIPVGHDPHYLPDTLVPHVTISDDADPEQAATLLSVTRWHLPMAGRAERLELWDDERRLAVLQEG